MSHFPAPGFHGYWFAEMHRMVLLEVRPKGHVMKNTSDGGGMLRGEWKDSAFRSVSSATIRP